MDSEYIDHNRLNQLCQELGLEDQIDEAVVPFAVIKREIAQYGKRRCDKPGSRDNKKYHIGYSFEAAGALDINSVALTGLLSLSQRQIDELAAQGVRGSDGRADENLTLVQEITRLLTAPRVFAFALQLGQYLQWTRNAVIYRQEVESFETSEACKDAKAKWRSRPVTRGQRYLIGEICRIQGIAPPAVKKRGEAFAFIQRAGGNPCFRIPPAFPKIREQS